MLQLNHKQRIKLGLFLKEARESTGLSQKDVALRAGLLSAQPISNIERGECSPPLYVLKIMQSLYRIEAWDLVKMITEMHQEILMQTLKDREKIKSKTK